MAICRAVLASRNYFTSVVFTSQKYNGTSTQCQPYSSNHSGDLLKKSSYKTNFITGLRTKAHMTDKYDWRDAALVVVGACHGIGAHILNMALDEGVASVVNLDINDKTGSAMQYELSHKFNDKNKVKFVKCDITNEQQQIEVLENVLMDTSKSYVLVNNAGLIEQQPDICTPVSDCNVDALVTGSLKALELMRRDEDGSGGAIINLTPVSVLCHLPYAPTVYNATQSSVLTFSMSLGNESFFSKTGVRVMSLCYGASDDGLIPIIHASTEENFENTEKDWASLKLKEKAAAEAVIEMYKNGRTGSTWLSKERKPPEDITLFVTNSYRNITELHWY